MEALHNRDSGPGRSLINKVRRILDPLSSRTFYIGDTSNQQLARIKYLRSVDGTHNVNYVVVFSRSTREPLRTIAVLACLVADNRIVGFWDWGGGG
jgi:hypothetical protein